MIQINKKILLGSGSPRRKLLLTELGINFRVLKSNTPEIPPGELIRGDIARFLSEEKAIALKNEFHADEILLTADTIVWLDSSMLGKPADAKEAYLMLKLLSGRIHQVYTAFSLLEKDSMKTICVESNVQFCKLEENEIAEYIENYQPFDKAGAYGAQECFQEGINPCSEKEINFMKVYSCENLFDKTISAENKKRIQLIDYIDGSFFNVMGLPVVELVEELNKLK